MVPNNMEYADWMINLIMSLILGCLAGCVAWRNNKCLEIFMGKPVEKRPL
jgi:hypothetical protein